MEIKLYSTTSCGYCRAAKQLLTARNLPFTEIDCTDDDETRERLVDETGQRTVPQIFLDGVPIGGFTDLAQLDRSGELAEILAGEKKPTSIAD
jgi:glutaredoxin 3